MLSGFNRTSNPSIKNDPEVNKTRVETSPGHDTDRFDESRDEAPHVSGALDQPITNAGNLSRSLTENNTAVNGLLRYPGFFTTKHTKGKR